jgi:hypothetical protein
LHQKKSEPVRDKLEPRTWERWDEG